MGVAFNTHMVVINSSLAVQVAGPNGDRVQLSVIPSTLAPGTMWNYGGDATVNGGPGWPLGPVPAPVGIPPAPPMNEMTLTGLSAQAPLYGAAVQGSSFGPTAVAVWVQEWTNF